MHLSEKPANNNHKQYGDNDHAPTAPRLVGTSEQISLTALINYAADQSATGYDTVLRHFLDHFGIATLPHLPTAQFDQAVKYLVDQMPNAVTA